MAAGNEFPPLLLEVVEVMVGGDDADDGDDEADDGEEAVMDDGGDNDGLWSLRLGTDLVCLSFEPAMDNNR